MTCKGLIFMSAYVPTFVMGQKTQPQSFSNHLPATTEQKSRSEILRNQTAANCELKGEE